MSNSINETMARATQELKEAINGHHEKKAAYASHLGDNPAEKTASDLISEQMESITSGIREENDKREGIYPTPSYEINNEGTVSEDGFKGAADDSDKDMSDMSDKDKETKNYDKSDRGYSADMMNKKKDDSDSYNKSEDMKEKEKKDAESPGSMPYAEKTEASGPMSSTEDKATMKSAHIWDLIQNNPDAAKGFQDGIRERSDEVLKSASTILGAKLTG